MLLSALLATALTTTQAAAPASEGERLAYILGCVRCHHQTPRSIQKSPSLVGVRRYTAEQFRALMKEGKTRTGKDWAAEKKLMGVLGVEQYVHLTDEEIDALYQFLNTEWTRERANAEQARIPSLWGKPY